MKKIIIIVSLLLSSFAFKTASAQIRLNFNIGLQPVWGPVGYNHAEYYYMPDIDVFYYIPNRQYIYQQGGRWTFSASLPYRYRDYDLNRGYKVVVNDARPYNHAETYRSRYAGYKGNHNQEIIRNSREPKYFENKDHPQHDKWNNGNRGDNDNRGNSYKKGNDNKDNKHGDHKDR